MQKQKAGVSVEYVKEFMKATPPAFMNAVGVMTILTPYLVSVLLVFFKSSTSGSCVVTSTSQGAKSSATADHTLPIATRSA